MAYWLMKSEPSVYGIEDLKTDHHTLWDGVRNHQARQFLQAMHPGDRAFFYHSNTKPPGIVGLMQITAANVIDPTQFDPNSDYHDPKATPEQPRWYTVQVQFLQQFPQIITLEQLKHTFTPEQLLILRRGNRLSVTPVEDPIATQILTL